MTLRVLTASESLERLSHAATTDAVWVLVDRPENLDEARKDVADLVACGETEGFFVGSAHWATSKNYNMPRVGLPDGWDADGDFRHFDLVNAWRKANHGQFVLLPGFHRCRWRSASCPQAAGLRRIRQPLDKKCIYPLD